MKINKVFLLIVFSSLILVVIILIVMLSQIDNNNKKIRKNFSNCEVLASSCNNQECQYNFLCNEKENQNCNVYDCGKEYGVEITEISGNVSEITRQKPDQEKIKEEIAKCQGSLQIIDKKECENGKAMANVKIETSGNCMINSFTMKINGQNRITKFIKENDVYILSVGQCGEISEIKAIREGGVEIREMETSVTNAKNQEMIDIYRDRHYLP